MASRTDDDKGVPPAPRPAAAERGPGAQEQESAASRGESLPLEEEPITFLDDLETFQEDLETFTEDPPTIETDPVEPKKPPSTPPPRPSKAPPPRTSAPAASAAAPAQRKTPPRATLAKPAPRKAAPAPRPAAPTPHKAGATPSASAATPAEGTSTPRAATPPPRASTPEPSRATKKQGPATPTPPRATPTPGPAAPAPRPASLPPREEGELEAAAKDVIAACEAALARKPDHLRAARLHYEIAQANEEVLGDLDAAARHYIQAHALGADHLPSIRGARRTLLRLGRHRDALPMFGAELNVTRNPRRRARIHYLRGRVYEESLADRPQARMAYGKALELDPNNPTLLAAVERLVRDARDWRYLAQLFERAANAVADDDRMRAALIARRARLHDTRLDDRGTAAELYESALKVDAETPGAVDALIRIYSERRDWDRLLAALRRAEDHTESDFDRAQTLYRMARIQWERLGNRGDAIDTLTRARVLAPDDPFVLDDLARLYRDAGDAKALTGVLRDLIRISDEAEERVALSHTLGQVFEQDLKNDDEAIACYRDALEIDPTFVPALQALGALLAKREAWSALIDMHLAEAEATKVTDRRAAAHTRVAEIYESRLQEPGEAARHHAHAVALVPGHPASFKALVRLYSLAGEHRKLVELYERAVDEAPSVERKIAYLFKIGSIWEDSLDDPAQAAHAYRRVLELRDNELGAIHALQRVCERAERYKELVEHLLREAVLTKDSDLVMWLRHRAAVVLDEQLGEHEAAQKLLLEVLAKDARFVPGLASLGRIYYRDGRWSELLEMYGRELEVTPEGAPRAALLCKMGELCENRLGSDADAIKQYRRAVDADPSYRPAVSALVRLLRGSGDHASLAAVFEQQLGVLGSPSARSNTHYRIAELCEEHLDDVERAIQSCRKAIDEVGDVRAPALALVRLLDAAKDWPALAEHLRKEVKSAKGPRRAAELLFHWGEVYRDNLDDAESAVEPFESARDGAARLASLIALEALYAQLGLGEALADVHMELVQELRVPAARLSELRQIARIQETQSLGDAQGRKGTYEAILEIEPDDDEALWRMAEIARGRNDGKQLAKAYERLRDEAVDDGLAADYWLRLAQTLEAEGETRALDAFRAASDLAPELISAARGLGRVAHAIGDAAAEADATRREADLTVADDVAAQLLVHSAEIRLERLGDNDGAIADLERALDRWPDSKAAAEHIRAPLMAAGRTDHLVDVLSRAAGSARQRERRAELWLAVSESYAGVDNLGAALAAVRRGLHAARDHYGCRRALADLHRRNQQWAEAAEALKMVVDAAPSYEEKCDAYLEQSEIWAHRLGKLDRARTSIDAAFELLPGYRPALEPLARLQLRTGDIGAARETAQRLLDGATDDTEKATGLTLLATILRASGDVAAAEANLVDAVALEGPGGRAAGDLRSLVSASGNWPALATSITTYIERGGDDEAMFAAYGALAEVFGGHMELPGKAIEALEAALKIRSDRRVLSALVEQLHRAGRHEDAAAHLKQLIAETPDQPALWHALVRVLRGMERDFDARLAVMPLVVLGAASDQEKALLRSEPARPAHALAHSIGKTELESIAVQGCTEVPAAELIAALAEALGKLWGFEPKTLGLGRRDRISPRSGNPARALVDRLCAIFGVECDLYQRVGGRKGVEVQLSSPVSLIVDDRFEELDATQQVFLLARPLALATARLHPVLALPSSVLAQVFAAHSDAGGPATSADRDELDQLTVRLHKAVPRKWRKAHDTAAAHYAPTPLQDIDAWTRAVSRTATRAAALVADDLVRTVLALSLVNDEDGAPAESAQPNPEDVSDLVRFWLSDEAQRVRSAAGLLTVRVNTPR